MRTRKTLVCGAAADRPQPAKPLCVVSEVTDVVLSEGSTASRPIGGLFEDPRQDEKRPARSQTTAGIDGDGSHAAAAATSTATTSTAATTAGVVGILVCVILGCAGRVAICSRISSWIGSGIGSSIGSRIARPRAVGVHHSPRSVAGDGLVALLEDLMLLFRYIAGMHGRSGGDQDCGKKCDYRCLHFPASFVGITRLNSTPKKPNFSFVIQKNAVFPRVPLRTQKSKVPVRDGSSWERPHTWRKRTPDLWSENAKRAV